MPPEDFALILHALEMLFDTEAAQRRDSTKLEYIRDVHDFLRRTITEK